MPFTYSYQSYTVERKAKLSRVCCVGPSKGNNFVCKQTYFYRLANCTVELKSNVIVICVGTHSKHVATYDLYNRFLHFGIFD